MFSLSHYFHLQADAKSIDQKNGQEEVLQAIKSCQLVLEAAINEAVSEIQTMFFTLTEGAAGTVWGAATKIYDFGLEGNEHIQVAADSANNAGFDVSSCTAGSDTVIEDIKDGATDALTGCSVGKLEAAYDALILLVNETQDIGYLVDEMKTDLSHCESLPDPAVCESKIIVTANHYAATMPNNIQRGVDYAKNTITKITSELEHCTNDEVQKAHATIDAVVDAVSECILGIMAGKK